MQYPHYDPALDNRPLDDAELEDLDRTLDALPQAMNVERLDGYLTALLLDPLPLAERPGEDWLPPVWGGDGEGSSPFASGRQKKRVVVLLLRHLHAIACQLQRAPQRWEPVFSVAESGDEEELVDAEEWCAGFLEATALHPQAWDPLFDDPVMADVLAPIALLGGDDTGWDEATRGRLADPVERDGLSRAVMDAVLVLHERRAGGAGAAAGTGGPG